MNHFLYLAVPILFGTAWLYTAHVLRTTLPSLRNKAICILIAHPDDEAMFFAPTVLALTDPKLGNHVKILCLSSGMQDFHFGKQRADPISPQAMPKTLALYENEKSSPPPSS